MGSRWWASDFVGLILPEPRIGVSRLDLPVASWPSSTVQKEEHGNHSSK
jgi:hypothetical protein